MPKPRFLSLEPSQQQDILQLASQEFMEHGLEGASMNRIITLCGISKGAMYYYFSGKEDLYRTVLTDTFGKLPNALGDVPSPDSPDTFWDDLQTFCGRGLRWFYDNPTAIPLFTQSIATPNDGAPPVGLEALADHLKAPMEAFLTKGQAHNTVRDDLPLPMMLQLLYQTGITCIDWLMESLTMLPEEQNHRLSVLTNLFRRTLQPQQQLQQPTKAPKPTKPTQTTQKPTPRPASKPALIDTNNLQHLQLLDENLWTVDSGPIRAMGLVPLPLRMTVVRLSSGDLWIHSPVRWHAGLGEEMWELGSVRHLVSPNKFHHLYLGEWATRHRDAFLYASPGLRRKRPELRFDATLDDHPSPAWSEDLDQVVFRGNFLLEEVVFFHKASGTVIFTDLIQNLDPQSLPWGWRRAMSARGSLAPNGSTPRDLRLTFRDRARAKDCLERILDWDIQKVILAHGFLVEHNARAFVENAFAWLR